MSESIPVLPNKVTLYRRSNSGRWQYRVKLKNGEWYRQSSGTDDLEEAKERALEFYYVSDYKQKNKLPQSTRKFKNVARYAIDRIISIFQRTYSWERSQCEQLWSDILRVGRSQELNSHFIGSAVYIPES